jgi:regulator of RNase E activity RraA
LNTRPPDIFSRATVGTHVVTPSDFVVADPNGVLFLPEDRLEDIITAAVAYRETEARQGHEERSKLPKSGAVQRVHVPARPGREL